MKKLLAAVATISLLSATVATMPAPASAAPHGGFGGGFRGGAFRGGFRGYGYRGFGYGGFPYFWGGVAVGAALWGPWGYYPYPYAYGYPAPYYYGDYGYYDPPPPPPGPPSAAGQAPPPSEASGARACGSWVWDPAQSKYNWRSCPSRAGLY